jgi:4-hydroxy-tetrahydrodipicolinate synthase
MAGISGVWAPPVTPFKDGRIDLASYRRLIEHLLGKGVSGVFPLGTTGEAPTLDDDEVDAIVDATVSVVAGRVPVFVGIGGNATHKVIRAIRRLEKYDFPGIVSVCPYYNRPTQDGLRQHFNAIAEATDRQILVYNIPYRTSVNLTNATLFELAELPNIVGVKDSSGSIAQSLDLLAKRPEGFSVLTGDDAVFPTMLANGADGGILAASHLATERFVAVARLFAANDHQGAAAMWAPLASLIPKLFQEANPIPIKHCLWRQGLIASPECRLPLTSLSKALADELDRWLQLNSAS